VVGALALRDGAPVSIDVTELAPGAVVHIGVGVSSPPTCGCSTRTGSGATKRCLTGESLPAEKQSEQVA
jgi:Mg2+-importing ATPase